MDADLRAEIMALLREASDTYGPGLMGGQLPPSPPPGLAPRPAHVAGLSAVNGRSPPSLNRGLAGGSGRGEGSAAHGGDEGDGMTLAPGGGGGGGGGGGVGTGAKGGHSPVDRFTAWLEKRNEKLERAREEVAAARQYDPECTFRPATELSKRTYRGGVVTKPLMVRMEEWERARLARMEAAAAASPTAQPRESPTALRQSRAAGPTPSATGSRRSSASPRRAGAGRAAESSSPSPRKDVAPPASATDVPAVDAYVARMAAAREKAARVRAVTENLGKGYTGTRTVPVQPRLATLERLGNPSVTTATTSPNHNVAPRTTKPGGGGGTTPRRRQVGVAALADRQSPTSSPRHASRRTSAGDSDRGGRHGSASPRGAHDSASHAPLSSLPIPHAGSLVGAPTALMPLVLADGTTALIPVPLHMPAPTMLASHGSGPGSVVVMSPAGGGAGDMHTFPSSSPIAYPALLPLSPHAGVYLSPSHPIAGPKEVPITLSARGNAPMRRSPPRPRPPPEVAGGGSASPSVSHGEPTLRVRTREAVVTFHTPTPIAPAVGGVEAVATVSPPTAPPMGVAPAPDGTTQPASTLTIGDGGGAKASTAPIPLPTAVAGVGGGAPTPPPGPPISKYAPELSRQLRSDLKELIRNLEQEVVRSGIVLPATQVNGQVASLHREPVAATVSGEAAPTASTASVHALNDAKIAALTAQMLSLERALEAEAGREAVLLATLTANQVHPAPGREALPTSPTAADVWQVRASDHGPTIAPIVRPVPIPTSVLNTPPPPRPSTVT